MANLGDNFSGAYGGKGKPKKKKDPKEAERRKEYEAQMKKYGSKIKRDEKGDIKFGWVGKKLTTQAQRDTIRARDRRFRKQ